MKLERLLNFYSFNAVKFQFFSKKSIFPPDFRNTLWLEKMLRKKKTPQKDKEN